MVVSCDLGSASTAANDASAAIKHLWKRSTAGKYWNGSFEWLSHILAPFFFSRVHGVLWHLVSVLIFYHILFHPQTCRALGEHTDFLKVQCVRIGAHLILQYVS
jgi:hypothetical protein